MSVSEASINQRIWQVVALIPRGRVATYGDVAHHAGLGRAARRVGLALRQLPEGSRLPWHRVINSAGKPSLPADSTSGQLQRQRLIHEGITFSASDRIDLISRRWRPGNESERAAASE